MSMFISVSPFVAGDLDSLVFYQIEALERQINDLLNQLDKSPVNATYLEKCLVHRREERDRLLGFQHDLKLAIRLSCL